MVKKGLSVGETINKFLLLFHLQSAFAKETPASRRRKRYKDATGASHHQRVSNGGCTERNISLR